MTGGIPIKKRRSVIKTCLFAVGRFCVSGFVHECVHLVWQGCKIIAAVLFFLWMIGIPGILLTDYLQPHVEPYKVKVSRITFSPANGIVIRGIELYDEKLMTGTLARIETCIVRPSYRRLLKGKFDIRSVRWSGGTIILPQEDKGEKQGGTGIPLFRRVTGSVIPGESSASLSIEAVSDIGSMYRIKGEIGYGRIDPAREQDPTWTSYLQRIHQTAFRTPAWITFIRERFSSMEFSTPPTVDISFKHDPTRQNQPTASLTYQAPSFTYYGQPFEGIDIAMTHSEGVVRINEAMVRRGEQYLLLTGSYTPSNEMFDAHLYSSLSTLATVPYLPLKLREKFESWGLKLTGAMKTEMWIGPCPIRDVPRNWGGWALMADAQLNDFPIERAFVSFKRDEHQFILEDGLITGGLGIGRGKVGFSLINDYALRTSQGTCDTTIELKQLEKVLPRGMKKVANYFDIETRPVSFTGKFFTPIDDLNQLVVIGDITGTNGAFRGVELTGLQAGLIYSNNHVNLDPLLVTCATGKVSGALFLDLKNQWYDIDLEITTNPETVAPMGGTNLARYFAPYHFTDDMFVQVKGLIDAKNDKKTDLAVSVSGRGIGYKVFTFDRMYAQATRVPGLLIISNIVGSIYQGTVTGRVDVMSAKSGDRFAADVTVTNISLDELVAAMGKQPTNQYEGWISGGVNITGDVPEPDGWPGVTGTGSLVIKDGRLMRIPVFGGLSTMLGKLFPGFGFSEQNMLAATFQLKNGKFYTDDLRLLGNMLSISFKGSYAWTDNLDFKVSVKPFRDGSVASIVRIVTLPLSFILELEMTGPFKNPRWRTANLPL